MIKVFGGLFLHRESQLPSTLAIQVEDQHCTFCFRPTEKDLKILDPLLGQGVYLTLTGYGKSKTNEGFSVRIEDPKFAALCKNKVPHITVGLSKDGKAVNTGALKFEPLEQEISLFVRFGYYTNQGVVFN